MKKFIFIMGVAIFTLCMNACKTQKGSNSSANNASASTTLVDKSWKLIELNGNPVSSVNNREPYIIFTSEGNRFNGDAGCNRIVGTYQIQEFDKITFSQVVATRMLCIDMEVENKFLEALNTADSFSIKNDTLTLKRAITPFARFVAF